MKKYITIALLLASFFCLLHDAKAQGFINKRIAVGYNFTTYFDFESFFYSPGVHEGNIDFILNRRAVAGLYFTGSGMDFPNPDHRFIYPDRRMNIKTRGVGLQFKWFVVNRGAIAPLGSYLSVKLASHFTTHSFTDILLPTGVMKTMHPGFSLGAGRNSLITGRLFFHFGVEAGVYPTIYRMEERFDFINYYGTGYTLSRHLANFKFGLVYVL